MYDQILLDENIPHKNIKNLIKNDRGKNLFGHSFSIMGNPSKIKVMQGKPPKIIIFFFNYKDCYPQKISYFSRNINMYWR